MDGESGVAGRAECDGIVAVVFFFVFFFGGGSFYQAAMGWRTVGVTNYFENGPHPKHPGAATQAYLAKGGIQRVIVGHKPFGDSPVVMRAHGLDIATCDTAFSDIVAFLVFVLFCFV